MSKLLTALMLSVVLAKGLYGQPVKAGAESSTTQVSPAKSTNSQLDVLEGEFMSAARAMPANKYDFTPASLKTPGAKFDGVRTFADEVKHVAQANYSIAAAITGTEADVKYIGKLKTKDEIVSALSGSFLAAHHAIDTLTTANQNDAVRDWARNETKGSLGAYFAVHAYDHYGQMVEYLRMNGIVPPAPPKAE